jgi:hypothetical protein
VVAFFTAGTMKMPWRRFLLLDGLGIVLMVPLLVWLGSSSAGFIDKMIRPCRRSNAASCGARSAAARCSLALWSGSGSAGASSSGRAPAEAFVQPQLPIQPNARMPTAARW